MGGPPNALMIFTTQEQLILFVFFSEEKIALLRASGPHSSRLYTLVWSGLAQQGLGHWPALWPAGPDLGPRNSKAAKQRALPTVAWAKCV